MSSITIAHILIIDSRVHYLRKLQEEEEENCGEGENHASPLSTDRLCRRFSLAEIKLATRNFDESLVVGKGGFGKVYKGIIDSGATTVAIKRLDFGSKQGAPEFWTEIQMLSKFRHSHLVSLIGYCNHPFEMILVYQYMSHGSLDANLHRIPRTGGDNASSLSWVQRLKICIGAARGLNYLHTGTGILHRVIHRDVKSSNILLDDNLEAKISDFGLSKIGPTDQTAGTHVTTHVKGTFGYLDPEYFLTRKLTRKSDVYAFGVILFEILCGRPAVDTRLSEEQWGLAFWSKRCIKEGKLLKIVDPNLRGSILSNCLNVFAETACQCLHNSSKRRPTMAEVVSRLEYALALQEGISPSGVDADILSDAEGYENQDDADPSTETEAKNAGHSEGQTVKVMQFGGASRSLPQTTPVKGMSFLKMVRVLFSAKAPIISAEEEQLYSLYSHVKRFSLSELQIATQNFSDGNIVGRDGFGKIYKGCLDNGSLVAIKRNIGEPTQTGLQQFLKQVEVTSLALHRNILQLLGFCATATERILVYPYMPNGCVASYLRDRPIMQPALDWRTRKRIALGSARGLAYLHDDCVPTTIHRDVKIANIFLDKEFEVVIGGFGFFKTMDCKNTHVTTAICGTVGHLAPEYLSTGKCSPKTDVFGYGIMLLELITGQRTFDLARLANDEDVMLLDWVKELQKEKMLERLVDADLQGDYVVEEVEQLLRVALLCARNTSTERPKMSEVVNMLQDGALVEELQHTEKMFNHSTPYTDDDWILRTDSIGYLNAEELSSPSRPVAVRLEGLYQ